jgi:hypothetical protein
MDHATHVAMRRIPWNRGKLVGQKAPLKLKDIWAIRVRLQIGRRTRELALLNLAIDSKLRSCDLVRLRVRDMCHGNVAGACRKESDSWLREQLSQQRTLPRLMRRSATFRDSFGSFRATR